MSKRSTHVSRPSRNAKQDGGPNHPEAVLEQLETFYRKWILPYSKIIAAAVIAILLVTLVVKGMEAGRVEREGKAFASLSEAEDADAYTTVASEHPDTAAAPRAYLQAARALFDEGKYERAATTFSLARTRAAGTELDTMAALGEAYALEAAGQVEVAEQRFKALAERATLDSLAADAWLGAGRCAKLQGKLAEAEKLYRRAEGLVGEDPFARQRVENALKALKTARYARTAAPRPADDGQPAPEPTQPRESGAGVTDE